MQHCTEVLDYLWSRQQWWLVHQRMYKSELRSHCHKISLHQQRECLQCVFVYNVDFKHANELGFNNWAHLGESMNNEINLKISMHLLLPQHICKGNREYTKTILYCCQKQCQNEFLIV